MDHNTLGWLKVRAEMTPGGDVHAFLRGTSALTETSLRAQAGDLQQYLGAQQTRVREVHVEPSQTMSFAGMTHDRGSNTGQQNSQQRYRVDPVRKPAAIVDGLQLATREGWLPTPQRLNGAGGWLSVLA